MILRGQFFLFPFLVVFCLGAQEMLKNNDFSNGFDNWGNPSIPQGSVSEVNDTQWGNGLFFEIQNGGTNNWDVQMVQSGINLRPGYTYKVTVKAYGNGGNRKILAGIGENGGNYDSYIELECNLKDNNHLDYTGLWENSDITNPDARFFVNGGGENVSFTLTSVSVFESKTPGGDPGDEFVLLNQVGFYTNGAKIAALRNGTGDSYKILSSDGVEVWSGNPGSQLSYQPSNETLRTLDFSDLTQEGTYTFYRNGIAVSREFIIAESPNREISKAALKAYYYQRASTEITQEHGGIWNCPAGHMDDIVYRHSTAGDGSFSSPKGWYDAGDYGKYIVNSGISTYTLMLLYTHFPVYMTGLSLNIPESSNNCPDILDEVKWNLDWMLTMQDEDGGVYHKLTTLNFESDEVMPHECFSERYVYMKTTAAALNFAAVMAKASNTYSEFDPAFAEQCLVAAEKSFSWAQSNPEVYYVQPPEVNTGEYKNGYLEDEFFWAAAQLQAVTGSQDYQSYLTSLPDTIRVPDWQYTAGLGLFTIAANRSMYDSAIVNMSCERLIKIADTLVENQNCGYGVSMRSSETDFIWGSNSMAANQGVVLLHAYYLTRDTKYLDAAVSQLDYLLGRNPLNICYVTGFGRKSPLNPHHRIMNADGVAAPVPGFLVGGPHTGGQDITELWGCENYIEYDATSYIDHYCSYATNEVTINWNASFSYLSNALEALFSDEIVEMFDWGSNSIIKPKLRGSNPSPIKYHEIADRSKLKFTLNLIDVNYTLLKVSIFNLAGKKILSETISLKANENEIMIDKKKIGRGIFIINVSDEKIKLNRRFIIK